MVSLADFDEHKKNIGPGHKVEEVLVLLGPEYREVLIEAIRAHYSWVDMIATVQKWCDDAGLDKTIGRSGLQAWAENYAKS